MTYKKRHATKDEGRRDFRPSLRLTRDEWEKVKAAAYAWKMSVSDWMVENANINQHRRTPLRTHTRPPALL